MARWWTRWRLKDVEALQKEAAEAAYALDAARATIDVLGWNKANLMRRLQDAEAKLSFWQGMWRAFAHNRGEPEFYDRLEALEQELAHDSERLEELIADEIIGADATDGGEYVPEPGED